MQIPKIWLATLSMVVGIIGTSPGVQAGGPLFFDEATGEPFRWFEVDGQNQITRHRATFYIETGPLGMIANDVVATQTRQAFQTWESVSIADLQIEELLEVPADRRSFFEKDITAVDFLVDQDGDGQPDDTDGDGVQDAFVCDALADPFNSTPFECELIRQCVANGGINCPSPVILDSGGEIFDLLGISQSVIGFSGPLLVLPSSPGIAVLQARVFINGLFFDGNPATPDLDNNPETTETSFDDPTGDQFLAGILTHEIGHFLGLAHSVVNGNQVAFNPAVESLGTGTAGQQNVPPPIDALISTPLSSTETMFPSALFRREDQRNFSDSLETDDEVALARLYPCTEAGQVAARAAGRAGCTQTFAPNTGTISGRVFIPDPTQPEGFKPAQGVVVVARCLNCPASIDNPDSDNPDSALSIAVSQLTGAQFAPRRCRINLGDGIIGLAGACQDESFPGPSDECNARFPGAVGDSMCGLSGGFGLSLPQLLPSAQENLYTLQGLPPGEYIVQVLQTTIGGFSSPVRSSFDPSTRILTDDDRLLNLFPNPQTGEFYNGPQTGCGDMGLACGDEVGNSSDNPFAFTPISVAAGQTVENVNIFLNTGDTLINEDGSPGPLFSSPGFDYCGLGDVGGQNGTGPPDGSVDDNDILSVIRAKLQFETDGTLTERADINQDGAITALDVDIITDIVTMPRPFDAPTGPEFIRGLAPFDAICVAARDGGCRIQAPVEAFQTDAEGNALFDAQGNLMVSPEICATASTLGCQVIGCPNGGS